MRAADRFEIIAGERRWLLAQMAGLGGNPRSFVRDVDDKGRRSEIAIVENVQRADLQTRFEEGQGTSRLDRASMATRRMISGARFIRGKIRSHVANSASLLKLPEEVRAMLAEGAFVGRPMRAPFVSILIPVWALGRQIAQGGLVRGADCRRKLGPGRMPIRGRGGPPGGGGPFETKSAAQRETKDADTLRSEIGLISAQGSIIQGQAGVKYKPLEQLDETALKKKIIISIN